MLKLRVKVYREGIDDHIEIELKKTDTLGDLAKKSIELYGL